MYPSPNITRVIEYRWVRWARHVARRRRKRNEYRVLAEKCEGRRPFGRPRLHRIHLAQDKDKWWAVENTVMNTRVLQDAWNSCD